MKIIHISYTDTGGAGIAVSRTHKRLQELGYNSILYLATEQKQQVKNKPNTNNNLVNKIGRRLKRLFQKKAVENSALNISKYCFYSTAEFKKIRINSLIEKIDGGDIVILYWLGHEVLNSSNIVRLFKKVKAPMFWYALDMAPVTGGCHYFWECTGYQNNCMNCPAFNYEPKSLAYYQLREKKKNLKKTSIKLLASSSIGIELFKGAALQFNHYSVLPYAIDTHVFDIKRNDAGPLSEDFVIFFNAQNVYDNRKGWDHFKRMLFILDELLSNNLVAQNISILSVAYEDHLPYFKDFKKLKLINAGGYASNERFLADLYQSSTVFICTSVEDLSPLMVNEALLCGIPVIGFKNASNAEYIVDNRNGNLIEPFDIVAMAAVIYEVIVQQIVYHPAVDIRNSVLDLHEAKSWNKKFAEVILNCN